MAVGKTFRVRGSAEEHPGRHGEGRERDRKSMDKETTGETFPAASEGFRRLHDGHGKEGQETGDHRGELPGVGALLVVVLRIMTRKTGGTLWRR